MFQQTIRDFPHWRSTARELCRRDVAPNEVQLLIACEAGLFAQELGSESAESSIDSSPSTAALRVPKEFLRLAEEVGYHRDADRWNLLYRVLWRLTHDEPQLMKLSTDDDMYRLLQMEKSVRRDAHKMKAFVRFREVQMGGQPHYIAWHRPDHLIVRKVAPFFSRRFKAMNWTILTNDESVTWDQTQLTFFEGVDRSAAPTHDELEELWCTYYANIFNPARIKLKAMRAEMPVRHWATLPETAIIEQMLQAAPARVEQMIKHSEGYERSVHDYFPDLASTVSLERLAVAIRGCRACDLYCHATQAVFGEGPTDARIVLVGEQPGDQEDLVGKPFVGPAGEVLNAALSEAGVDRAKLYVTNVVKHFKFESQGKRRLHKRPDAREIRACRPWFDAEWSQLKARILVCLGATSATALIAPGFRLQQQRGQWVTSKYSDRTLATWHPSSILRLPNEDQRQARMQELIADLRKACAEIE